MNFASKLFAGLKALFTQYPALLSGVISIVALVAAHFGWHVSTAELTLIGSIFFGVGSVAVHSLVTPVAKLKAQPVSEHSFENPDDVRPYNLPPTTTE